MSTYEIPIDFKKQIQPMTQLVGIDYGTKRIGVAISDLMQMTATPLKIVSSMDELEKLLIDRKIGGFVIWLPKQMNGEEGEQAKITRVWAEKLYEKYSLPILFWDERLSSAAVSRIFIEQADLSRKRQKEVMDKVAAAYILQGALDLIGRL
ncbi:MAG: Holliday junction resolvase RuvX [Alphaproteobacteria bacterium]|nr:Holliday junction resolvase RuvX [Alphaproteobacteria bacterium]